MLADEIFPLDTLYFSEAIQVAVYISVLTLLYLLYKRFR
jgi:hypothetical protein